MYTGGSSSGTSVVVSILSADGPLLGSFVYRNPLSVCTIGRVDVDIPSLERVTSTSGLFKSEIASESDPVKLLVPFRTVPDGPEEGSGDEDEDEDPGTGRGRGAVGIATTI